MDATRVELLSTHRSERSIDALAVVFSLKDGNLNPVFLRSGGEVKSADVVLDNLGGVDDFTDGVENDSGCVDG